MVSVPYRHPRSRHVFHQYTIKLNNKGGGPGLRDHVAAHLQAEGVPFGIYYPKPIHQQDAFSDVPGGTPELPVTEDLTDRVLSLPMHTELTEPQQRRVVDAILGGLDSYI